VPQNGSNKLPGRREMEGASEYVVVEGTRATFEALREAVHERGLSVVEDDPRHLRLAFRLEGSQESGQVKALCAILDAGHGLSKLVVVCIDEAHGTVAAPDDSLTSLFIQVEHTLHTPRGKRMGFALPPLIQAEVPGEAGL
jgi:hypothetical protein